MRALVLSGMLVPEDIRQTADLFVFILPEMVRCQMAGGFHDGTMSVFIVQRGDIINSFH